MGNVGDIKGDKGDTGDSGFSPIVNVDHDTGQIIITTADGSVTVSFDELKGDVVKLELKEILVQVHMLM